MNRSKPMHRRRLIKCFGVSLDSARHLASARSEQLVVRSASAPQGTYCEPDNAPRASAPALAPVTATAMVITQVGALVRPMGPSPVQKRPSSPQAEPSGARRTAPPFAGLPMGHPVPQAGGWPSVHVAVRGPADTECDPGAGYPRGVALACHARRSRRAAKRRARDPRGNALFTGSATLPKAWAPRSRTGSSAGGASRPAASSPPRTCAGGTPPWLQLLSRPV